MAKPGYGKRSAPDQRPRTRDDFALLPTREGYVAGFIDHLPEGAAMSVKQLAKQLPLYGQQAISTSLSALSVAGHLRRVRCPVGTDDQVRWAYRTFWSRTARDNEWWNTYLATETAAQAIAPADAPTPPPPWVPAEEPVPSTQSADPAVVQSPEPAAIPQQRTPLPASDVPQPRATEPAPPTRPTTPTQDTVHAPPTEAVTPVQHARDPEPSAAYLALAHLGHNDHRLALSAHDCTTLEPLATAWLARGVSVDYLTSALTAGLPAQIDSPAGLLHHRLTDKIPPQLPTTGATPPASDTPAPARRILIECTTCGRPGPPEALPDGLCRLCHQTHAGGGSGSGSGTPSSAEIAVVKAHMANLRALLKPV
ncbi:MarR family transcriptional regulator [Streptomyces sp. NBC_01178]|uniref:MarR family transcriptional regulator n=1 Tax=Streptomyces sp. NBC_01178 TaxID=2903762 RepID=UPI003863E4F4|nr:MarR family transcriptional regulator [Streptomyces sp. NBC_01178]